MPTVFISWIIEVFKCTIQNKNEEDFLNFGWFSFLKWCVSEWLEKRVYGLLVIQNSPRMQGHVYAQVSRLKANVQRTILFNDSDLVLP
jgi:hypothetical protein